MDDGGSGGEGPDSFRVWAAALLFAGATLAIHLEGAHALFPESDASVLFSAGIGASELTFLAAFVGGLVLSRWSGSGRLSVRTLLALTATFILWLQATAVEFLANVGTPLTQQVFDLALREAMRVLKSGVKMGTNAALIASAGGVMLFLILLGPRLRVRHRLVSVCSLLLIVPGGISRWQWRDDYRFGLLSSRLLRSPDAPEVSNEPAMASADPPALDCGPTDERARNALDWSKHRVTRVVVFVMESVGSRFIDQLGPFGGAKAPNIGRLLHRGSITFENASSLGPLSVQTAWALTYGMVPPVKPFGFSAGIGLPRANAISLQEELQARGVAMAHVNAGQLAMWGFRKVVGTPSPDYLAEGVDLATSERAVELGWGVEDRAIFSAGLTWLKNLGERAGVLILWNIETHYPFSGSDGRAVRDPADPFSLKAYVTAIERADRLLGGFMDALEARHELSRTVFVVVGDHGEGFGRFGRPFDQSHGYTVTEDAIRVPLVLSHPGLDGRMIRVDTPVSHADLYPTIVDLVSAQPVDKVDGVSLLRAIPSRPLIIRGSNFWPAAVRCGREKLVVLDVGYRGDLYDTESDPEESRDLSMERQARFSELNRYLRWHQFRGARDPWYGYGSNLLH